jgi:hypothetical protein
MRTAWQAFDFYQRLACLFPGNAGCCPASAVHQTVIQALPLTVGVDNKTMILLDSLRKQRNVSDYSEDPAPLRAIGNLRTRLVYNSSNLRGRNPGLFHFGRRLYIAAPVHFQVLR